jgi:hypothetical protein
MDRRGANECRREIPELFRVLGGKNLPRIIDWPRHPVAVEKMENQILTGVADA